MLCDLVSVPFLHKAGNSGYACALVWLSSQHWSGRVHWKLSCLPSWGGGAQMGLSGGGPAGAVFLSVVGAGCGSEGACLPVPGASPPG